MLIIFLGAPGTGKGTISTKLKNEYGYIHFSTGELFRTHINNETPIGLKVKKLIANGVLIDDEITFNLLKNELDKIDLKNKKVILDGFPRTINQNNLLEKYLEKRKFSLDKIINFSLSIENIIERLSGRLICTTCSETYHKIYNSPKIKDKCNRDKTLLIQREDDKEENIIIRLEEYNKLTLPLVDFYKNNNKLININVDNDIKNITKEVLNVINKI